MNLVNIDQENSSWLSIASGVDFVARVHWSKDTLESLVLSSESITLFFDQTFLPIAESDVRSDVFLIDWLRRLNCRYRTFR